MIPTMGLVWHQNNQETIFSLCISTLPWTLTLENGIRSREHHFQQFNKTFQITNCEFFKQLTYFCINLRLSVSILFEIVCVP